MAGRRCSYGDAADRQCDRANKGLPRPATLSAFSRARARSPSSGGGGGSWPGAGAATGMLLIDSAIARTKVCARVHYLVSVSRARARGPAASGFDPGAPASSYGVASARADRNRWPRGCLWRVCALAFSGCRDRALYPWACGRRGGARRMVVTGPGRRRGSPPLSFLALEIGRWRSSSPTAAARGSWAEGWPSAGLGSGFWNRPSA